VALTAIQLYRDVLPLERACALGGAGGTGERFAAGELSRVLG
jgi:hypothetical protein